MKFREYIPYYKRNLHLAFPIVLSQIGQIMVALIDNAMVGHVGTTELAAASFANSVFMIGMVFGMGLTFGMTPLVGTAFGNKDVKSTVVWLKNGIFTHLIAAMGLTLLMFGVYLLLPFMGQTPEVLALAKPYFILLCFSYLPFILFFSFKQFFEGVGNTKMAMAITLSANVVNIVVNYVLIFGKFGFPELGLIGAGIGTLVSRIVMPIMFIVLISRKARFLEYFKMANREIISGEKIIQLLKIGVPIGFQLIVEVTAFGIGAVMMGWLGETPLAAHQVALGLASFTYMISLGVSQANTIRVSHQIGLKDYRAMKTAAVASTHLVLAFMSIAALAFIGGKNVLPYLFTTDVEVVRISAGLLIIAAVFQIFDGLQVVMLSTLRGMSDVTAPMFIAFIAYLLIGIPTSYGFAFLLNIGPQGIWFGYLVGLGTAGILFYFRFKKNLRKLSVG
ncbi:MATE family efflux transporter [Maribellus sediminis]|uniref:MATE family efflux transporter n=1 Tax=Maribellus sediminis TaxID=2696285 RepID=UPI00142FB074|nr:MATE family efflux transporter [Maribellus sediminis]